MALLVLVPLAWVIGNALRPNGEIGVFTDLQWNTFVPQTFTLENFGHIFGADVFTGVTMLDVIGNTVFVAVFATLISLFVNAMAAYAFARINFLAKNLVFFLVVSLLVLPLEVLIIPLYLTVRDLGLKDSLFGLILIYSATPFGIFFLRQFFLNTPRTLDEAAILDGCGHFKIFSRIYLPLARTPLITLGLLAFMQQWDSYIAPVSLLETESKMLLQVALTRLAVGLYANDYGLMFAGVAVSIVPMVVLFLFFQRYIVENVATTGIKG